MFGRIYEIDLSLRIWLCDLLFIGCTRVVHARSETMCLSLLNLIFTGSLISGCKACFDFSSSKFENNWLCLYNYMEKFVSKHSVFCGKPMASVWREIKNVFKSGTFTVIASLKPSTKSLRQTKTKSGLIWRYGCVIFFWKDVNSLYLQLISSNAPGISIQS